MQAFGLDKDGLCVMHDTPIGGAQSQHHVPANQGGSEEGKDADIIVLARQLSDTSNKETQVPNRCLTLFSKVLMVYLRPFYVLACFP